MLAINDLLAHPMTKLVRLSHRSTCLGMLPSRLAVGRFSKYVGGGGRAVSTMSIPIAQIWKTTAFENRNQQIWPTPFSEAGLVWSKVSRRVFCQRRLDISGFIARVIQ